MADGATSETLAWEEEYRTRTALAAVIGGNLVLIGGVALGLVLDGVPQVGLLDGLRSAAGEKLSVGPGLRTNALQFYDDRMAGLLAAYAIQAFGALLTAAVLGYLFRATKARRPEFPRAALYVAVGGPVVLGVSLLTLGIGFSLGVHDFVSKGDLSTKAAHDALDSGLLLAAPVLHSFSGLAVAFAFVLVSINAMRVGLLTRFMGGLGVIAGALFIFPIGSSFLIQGFWMVAFGFMIFGRWPNGRPPAWETGHAEPWPTQQQLREAREASSGKAKPVAAAPAAVADDAIEPAAPSGTPHSSSKKKKRKRR